MTNKRYVDQLDEFVYDKNKTSMPMTLGTLVFVCFCILMLIIVTFIQINLFQYAPTFDEADNMHFVLQSYPYIIQIPIVILIAGLLGMRFSLLTMIIYILMGLLIWPIFAFGGGFSYLKTHFFGYILGYIPCVIFVSFFLKKFNNYKGVLIGGIAGPLIIYITAFLYGLILLLFRQIDASVLHFEMVVAPLAKIPYDILFSLILLSMAKPLRCLLWLMCGNTKKPKKKVQAK